MMMNKYTELSDFEINKRVAEELYYKFEAVGDLVIVTKKYVGCFLPSPVFFDPCNNPVDAMPIIIENKLTLSPRYDSDEWISESLFYHDIYSVNKNLYRAAMEVFLMMKDAENEKV
ncbi:phage protein NinX family protein [Providencia stuartii]|uniref:phage protein NinX family protein n=1 Tax=Providencia stuartii TaxID=588 RepID=UPI0032DAEA31